MHWAAKPATVIALECTCDTAEMRLLSRGEEKSDDEGQFGKRYVEYVKKLKAVREHYAGII